MRKLIREFKEIKESELITVITVKFKSFQSENRGRERESIKEIVMKISLR